MTGVKTTLGVRTSTTNDICLLELGLPTLEAFVKQRQHNFFSGVINSRSDMTDDPLMFLIRLTQTNNRRLYKIIDTILAHDNYVTSCLHDMKNAARVSQRSKSVLYMEINPSLTVHCIYNNVRNVLPEPYRLSLTRMRLSAHRLKVETGRWYNILRERRLC